MICKTCGRRAAEYMVNDKGYCGECLQPDSFKEVAALVMPGMDAAFFDMVTISCDCCKKTINRKEKNVYHLGRRFIYCADCVKVLNV